MIKNIIVQYYINNDGDVRVELESKHVTLVETYNGVNIYCINSREKDGYLAICTDYNQSEGYLYTIMDKGFYDDFNEDKKLRYFDNLKRSCNREHMMELYDKYIYGGININIRTISIYHINIFVDDNTRKDIINTYTDHVSERNEEKKKQNLTN